MMDSATISVIAGDGIGPEILPGAIRCVERAAANRGLRLRFEELDWGSDRYLRTGRMMPADALHVLARTDAIFLGAVGHPDVPDTETLWGLLIPIRRGFDQYVNLRLVRTLPGVATPLKSNAPIDFVIVRENTE